MYKIKKFLIILPFLMSIETYGYEFRNVLEIKEVERSIETRISLIAWDRIEFIGGKANESKEDDEDLVFFSYDSTKEIKIKEVKTPEPTLKEVETSSIAKAVVPNMQVDYSQFVSSSHYRTTESFFEVSIRRIGNKGLENQTIKEFDIVPYYDTNEIFTDSGLGIIKVPVGNTEKTPFNFKSSIAARNIQRTNFEISPVANGIYSIPVFDQEIFDQLVKDSIQRENYGSYLLVNLGEDIDNTDIDKKYTEKIYLSSSLKKVSVDSEYKYELYLDVEPGNVLVKYLDFNGNTSEKILHLINGEVTYDESEFINSTNYSFEVYEENLLSKKNLPVDIREKQIRYFNTNIKSTKMGLNRYSIKIPKRDIAFRKYLEIDYGSKIYVGVEDRSKLKLPGEDFVPYVKNILRVDASQESCMIQVNLSDSLKIFNAQVTSDRETGSYEIYYMDKDGTFSKELTGLSEKIFIVSNDYGVVNMMLKDQKNNIKYYQSFCTNSLYIIENF